MRKKTLELQQLELMIQRGYLRKDEQLQYKRLLSGFEGEEQFDQLIKEFAPESTDYHVDFWLSQESNTQIDTLAIRDNCLTIYDIKNYQGDITYSNEVWTINARPIDRDIFNKIQYSYEILRKIIKTNQLDQVSLEYYLVFINPYSKVEILDPNVAKHCLTVADLRQHFKTPFIPTSKNNYNKNYVYQKISQHVISNPYDQQLFDDTRLADLKTGIQCPNCHSLKMFVQGHSVLCSCGYKERQTLSILRHACDWGILHNTRPLDVRSISEYTGGLFHPKLIQKILKTNFGKYPDKLQYYHNPKCKYKYWKLNQKS